MEREMKARAHFHDILNVFLAVELVAYCSEGSDIRFALRALSKLVLHLLINSVKYFLKEILATLKN